MKTAIFEYGKQPLAEWIKENSDCEKMILVGNVYPEIRDDIFLHQESENIYSYQPDIDLGCHSYDLLYGFEKIAKDFRPAEFDIFNMHLLDFDGNIDDEELSTECAEYQPSIIYKMLANRKYGTTFIYNDGLITTLDKKVLIHSDKITNAIHVAEGIETIGRLAFAGIKKYENKTEFRIILPDGILNIEECAFLYSNLSEINFPDSLRSLGDCAFMGTELKEVMLPDGIEEIPTCCFTYTWIEKLRLPSNLKAIRSDAFVGLYCDEIRLPQSIEIVEGGSLDGIYKKIYIPKTIKKLAHDFYYEEGIDDYHDEHKPIIIKY